VKPAPFAYHRAYSVAETVALLAELGDEAKILAGGLSLVPMMNFRLARPAALVDVTRIEGLSYLRVGQDGLRIGALTTHRAVETSTDPAVRDGFGVLPRSGTTRSGRAARSAAASPTRTRPLSGACSPSCSTPASC
jgi:aerobic carbon-monoxide dehydrogenase medium subunit